MKDVINVTPAASLRLLSFLQSVEVLLSERAGLAGPVRRQANYRTGRAWLARTDGEGLLLHAAALEGGCIWLRACVSKPDGGVVVERSVYGGSRGFDWDAAAEEIVTAWLARGRQAGKG